MNVKFLYPGFKTKAFTFSYDDGVIHDKTLVDKLNTYGFKCTFNLNTGLSGSEKFRNDIDCSILNLAYNLKIYNGHEIASHTYAHPHLENCTLAEQYDSYKKDIDILERWTGKKVIGSAYPYGTYNDFTLQVLRDLGIKYARTVRSTYAFHRPYDFLLWHPTIHHRDSRLFPLLEEFMKTDEELAIFYLWGHSYEFALDNNFDLIDKIADVFNGDTSIWHATNAEIYEYLKATDLVVYKNQSVSNYSRHSIWCIIDGKERMILPRQTIEIGD